MGNNPVHYQFDICAYCGDNKAQNESFGHQYHFHCGKFCRICDATNDDIQTKFKLDEFLIRTNRSTNKAIKDILSGKETTTSTGIKSHHCFSRFKKVLICIRWEWLDMMHDISGILKIFNKIIVKKLCKSDTDAKVLRQNLKNVNKLDIYISGYPTLNVRTNSAEVYI